MTVSDAALEVPMPAPTTQTLSHALKAEWRKLTPVSTPTLGPLLMALVLVGLSSAVFWATGGRARTGTTSHLFDCLRTLRPFAALGGAAVVGAEFRQHTFVDSLLMVAARERLLAAKLLTAACYGIVCSAVIAVVAEGVVLAASASGRVDDAGALDGRLLRALLVNVLFAVLGAALAAALRKSITAVLAVYLFALEPLLGVVLGRLGGGLGRFLPGPLGDSVLGTTLPWLNGPPLPMVGAIGVLLGAVAALTAVALRAWRGDGASVSA